MTEEAKRQDVRGLIIRSDPYVPKRPSLLDRNKTRLTLYALILPALLYFLVLTYVPLVQGVVGSVQSFEMLGGRQFVGLENYRQLFLDPTFWQVFWNTLVLGSGMLALGFIAPVLIALSLNEVVHLGLKKVAQMIIYIPHLFSWVVVGGLGIYLLSPDGGLVNTLLLMIDGRQIHFMTNVGWSRIIIILVAIWKDMGFNAILYLAAIVGISPTLYEAARTDGATRWHEAWYITVPQLVPTMKVVFLLSLMGILRIFEQIYVMRNSVIEPRVDVLMTYVYDKGLQDFNLGLATAASMVVLVATLGLMVVVRRLIRYDN